MERSVTKDSLFSVPETQGSSVTLQLEDEGERTKRPTLSEVRKSGFVAMFGKEIYTPIVARIVYIKPLACFWDVSVFFNCFLQIAVDHCSQMTLVASRQARHNSQIHLAWRGGAGNWHISTQTVWRQFVWMVRAPPSRKLPCLGVRLTGKLPYMVKETTWSVKAWDS